MTFEGDISAVKATRTPVRGRPSCKFPPVAETVLAPLLGRLLPQIAAAQKQGLLPAVDPILFHYMMVSLTATLSGFGPEMRMTSGLSSSDPKVVEACWRLVDEMVFGKEGKRPALLAGGDTARGTSATNRRR
jgi:TetR/AcrR family transcriptional regulator